MAEKEAWLKKLNRVMMISVPLLFIAMIILDVNYLLPWSNPETKSISKYEFLDIAVERMHEEKGIVFVNDSIHVFGGLVSEDSSRTFWNMNRPFRIFKPNADRSFYTIQHGDSMRFNMHHLED